MDFHQNAFWQSLSPSASLSSITRLCHITASISKRCAQHSPSINVRNMGPNQYPPASCLLKLCPPGSFGINGLKLCLLASHTWSYPGSSQSSNVCQTVGMHQTREILLGSDWLELHIETYQDWVFRFKFLSFEPKVQEWKILLGPTRSTDAWPWDACHKASERDVYHPANQCDHKAQLMGKDRLFALLVTCRVRGLWSHSSHQSATTVPSEPG